MEIGSLLWRLWSKIFWYNLKLFGAKAPKIQPTLKVPAVRICLTSFDWKQAEAGKKLFEIPCWDGQHWDLVLVPGVNSRANDQELLGLFFLLPSIPTSSLSHCEPRESQTTPSLHFLFFCYCCHLFVCFCGYSTLSFCLHGVFRCLLVLGEGEQ